MATEPCEVECQATYRKKGFTDNIEGWNATFTFASGLKMIFTDETQQKPGTRFIGDKGWVHVDRAGIWAEPESLLKVKLKDDELHLHASKHHQDDFLNCVRSRKDPVSNVDATHVASYLGLIADIAARLEAKLKWDPKAERFVGNDEANQMLEPPDAQRLEAVNPRHSSRCVRVSRRRTSSDRRSPGPPAVRESPSAPPRQPRVLVHSVAQCQTAHRRTVPPAV